MTTCAHIHSCIKLQIRWRSATMIFMEQKLVLRRFADDVINLLGTSLVKIILYGSYARGDYDNQSDIDIAAIVKGSRLDLQNKLKAVWDISADIGLENDVVVSPTVIPYDEFEEYKEKLPYYRNIAREGMQIG